MSQGIIKERFNNIDFFRFLFAIMIAMFHFKGISGDYAKMIPGIGHWHVCVDFFFIISGFFLFHSFKKDMPAFEFIKKRFFRLAPLIWLFLILLAIFYFISGQSVPFDYYILRATLLSNIGFAPNTLNGNHWFIPVLFWVSIFYFYIGKTFEKKYLNLVVGLVTFFSLTVYLQWTHFNTGGYLGSMLFINKGVLRGLFGMGIGYFINELFNINFLKNCTKISKIGISFCEIFCVGLLGYFLSINKLPGKSAFLYILIFAVIFFLFLRKQGFLSRILDRKIFVVLGSWAYAIYVIHPLIKDLFKYFIKNSHNSIIKHHSVEIMLLYLLCTIIMGVLIYYLFEKPFNKFINEKLCSRS